ncbi:HET-domain-containing protein [Rhizopogon vinicolor AM-OR11-026]|uniref:HET-domain-containing protein n=1 Tax=Rhizopogon vinicolor AM-OR11-026 TaxID=1314800 RepID=A0A1B7MRC5_9AGAM|nr:HET-domain-containing protein [Rhizopogon vinicolor AM-OR11-026]
MFCLSKRQRRTRAKESSLDPIPSSGTKEIPNEDDAPLCSVCSALDLRTILQYGVPRKHAIFLGQLTDILDKYDKCGLCRLVTTVVRRQWQLSELPDLDLAEITCALYTTGYLVQFLDDSPWPRVERLNIRISGISQVLPILKAAHTVFSSEIELLEEDASKVGRTKGFHGRRVGQNVDIDLLKRWIHICEHGHLGRCEKVWWRSAEDVLPKVVRVLDVTRMAIVPAPAACRYVALSYVWGGMGEEYWTTRANLKPRSRRGGLDASLLPGTISDTIQLIRQLGERYLWIDALCIVQDDPEDKAVQIRVMELIYGSSVFTIFAVGCTSARDPLPGVRPGTRDPQQQITKIQGLHLAIPNSLNEVIARSAWNQRGWTYQEVMLSRRCIFITAYQVYFECKEDQWCEGAVAEPVGHSRTTIHGGRVGREFARVHQSDSRAYFQDYNNIIHTITQRRLTVESDIVDAITALLSALTKGYKVADDIDKAFRFGMPLVDLAVALLWQPTANASHSRRASWPSWSWAGWRGAAGYSDVSLLVNIHASMIVHDTRMINESLVEQWYIIDDNGEPVRQDVRHYGYTREPNQTSNSSTYVAPKGDIDTQQLIAENAPRLPTGTLVFRTNSARFDVMKAQDVAGANIRSNYAIYSILSDIPRPSTLVGRVTLPCSTHSPTSYEFIVLSRTDKCNRLYDEDTLGRPYMGCMLYVMVVRKIQGETRMERVGVGAIFEAAWPKSTAEQKIILLG